MFFMIIWMKKIGENKMTIGEKLDLGLDPFETDTSNGLSDWEAIHEYDLDPKKFSMQMME